MDIIFPRVYKSKKAMVVDYDLINIKRLRVLFTYLTKSMIQIIIMSKCNRTRPGNRHLATIVTDGH